MVLFELENGIVKFAPQALALKPFAALWKRDRTKDKKVAVAELACIYFVTDYRSDYSKYVDEETRYNEVREMIDLPDKWKPDDKFQEAVELYKELQKTPAIKSLESARISLHKIDEFVRTVDLNEKNEKTGNPLYKPTDLMRMNKDLEGALDSLEKVEERVKKQIEKKREFKGQLEAADFEDGDI